MKGYRTIALNLAAGVVGILLASDWVTITDPRTAGMILTALGVANFVLRFATNTSVGSKD